MLSHSVMSDSLWPLGLEPTTLLYPWGFSRQEYWSGLPYPPPGVPPNPGIEPRSPALQEDSLLSKPAGKPKNTGLCGLSLLQGIFPTQELNWGLLHCRQIFLPAELPGKPHFSLKLLYFTITFFVALITIWSYICIHLFNFLEWIA